MGKPTEINVGSFRVLSSVDRDAAATLSLDLARRAAGERGRACRLTLDEIDDVEGEIVAALWGPGGGTLDGVDAESSLLGWMRAVADHKAFDQARRNVRIRGLNDRDAIRGAQCAARAQSRGLRRALFSERDLVAVAPRQRRALDLHVTGRTYRQIASELEIGHYRAVELVRLAWNRLRLAHAKALAVGHPMLATVGWERLKPRQRRIATLWNSGRTRAEISRIEGLSIAAVRGAIFRIRGRLESALS